MRLAPACLFACLLGLAATAAAQPAYDDALLRKLRAAAGTVPGAAPEEVRYARFAESPRTFAATVEGGDDTPYVQARTAYQLRYPDGWIMVDTGMDEAVHRFFGRGAEEPYDAAANARIQRALRGARLVLVTHEHGDHVAGVLRSPHYAEIAPKTILTAQQVDTLVRAPQMPELRMDPAQRRDFIVVDFEDVLPVAPGVALVQAPGHTPGELMVYARLRDGREFLITGDVSWSYAGIEQCRQKPAAQIARIGEDAAAIAFQLDWLNGLPAQGVQLLVNHDDLVQPRLAAEGVIGAGLLLDGEAEPGE